MLCGTIEVSLRDPFNLRIGGLRTYVAQLGNKLGSKCTHLAQKAAPFLLAPSAVEHQVEILDEFLRERLFQTAPRDHQKNVGGKGGVPKNTPKIR